MKFYNKGNTLKWKYMQNYYKIEIGNSPSATWFVKLKKIDAELFSSIHPVVDAYQNELGMLPFFWATEKIFKMVSFVESLMFDSQVIAVFLASVQFCSVPCKYDL